jgi:deazaflavin-dependent oxidoreductase (nitroreductase family)
MTAAPRSGWFRRRPGRLLRWSLRAPIALYRLHLGWLLGRRFLLLTHRGRHSGKLHRTLLEVVQYDPRTHECIVAAGWGERAAWYRNLKANPAVAVSIGRERYRPIQRFLGPEEADETLRRYQRQHRLAAWIIVHLFGMPLGKRPLPMVAFRPPST